MKRIHIALGMLGAAILFQSPEARACGGFFCGRQPVDQTAERILFEVGEDSVTMTTQISFNGAAPDFAWILPLGAVPDPDSLEVFSQRALTGLDANSGPEFIMPSDCYPYYADAVPGAATGNLDNETDGGDVTVYIRAEVGDYDVAVVESSDPAALITWLRDNGYRVTEPMEPFIELYTEEDMKFLALKLLDTADVNDIKPFRFTLPGTTPSIPLRMTALAAEPEMSILVFIVGDERYEAKNWANVTIDDADIRYNPYSYSWPIPTNWAKLVAQAVDEADGQGWVTEFAGSTEDYAALLRSQIDSGSFATAEDEEAANALIGILESHPYMTRLYSRLSAEEMVSDPIFGRSAGGDVSRTHELQRIVDGVDQCDDTMQDSNDPCDFATCGAGGVCRAAVLTEGGAAGAPAVETEVAGCACVPGATARTTFAPDGSATVICQDARMSFLNPGDAEAGAEALPDPCATFDCGPNGRCTPVNMTPTCVCNEGYIATGSFDDEGARLTTCIEPSDPIPGDFYDERLPDSPLGLVGREVDVPDPPDGGATTSGSTATGGSGGSDGSGGSAGAGATNSAKATGTRASGCSVVGVEGRGFPAWLGLLSMLALRRRRRIA